MISKRSSTFTLPGLMGIGVLLFGLVLVGCDSAGSGGGETSTTANGRVTNDQSYGGSQQRAALRPAARQAVTGVEGAVVTAVRVRADGSVSSLSGRAITDAEGRYTIDFSGQPQVVRLTAQSEGGFESSVIAFVNGRSTVQVAPMTVESDAEAEVYVEAKAGEEEGEESVTTADVAVHVTAETATAIETGAVSAAEVAAAIYARARAESAYARHESESSADAAQQAKLQAYFQLQAALHAASGAEAETAAIQAFEEAVATAYTDAGATAETQANAHLVGLHAFAESSSSISSEARIALRKQAEILAAYATSRAIEAAVRAQGDAEAQLQALADARAQLIAALRAEATASQEDIAAAKAQYEAEVEAQVRVAFGISETTYATARTQAKSGLQTALGALVDIVGFVDSYANAYSNATADVETTFAAEVNGTDAEASAKVVVLVTAFVAAS